MKNPIAAVTAPVTAPLAIGPVLRELVEALRVLPQMAEDVRLMREGVERLSRDASVLPEVRDATSRLDVVEERMAQIAETMPEVEQLRDMLAPLPRIMDELLPALTQLHETTSGLEVTVAALGEALEPIGRVADRIPGGSRRAGKNGD